MADTDFDFDILGQKFNYPRTAYGTICVFLFLTAVVALVYAFANLPKERLVYLAQFYETVSGKPISKSSQDNLDHPKLIQFWTPSEDTAKSLLESGPMKDDDKWQMVTEKKVQDFAERIETFSSGYRRYKVVGKGSSKFKVGWWWVVTVKNTYKVEDFVQYYGEFWGTKKAVYVEELGSDPRYFQNAQ
jgi:hypothetical protein